MEEGPTFQFEIDEVFDSGNGGYHRVDRDGAGRVAGLRSGRRRAGNRAAGSENYYVGFLRLCGGVLHTRDYEGD